MVAQGYGIISNQKDSQTLLLRISGESGKFLESET